jgi:hypothetical protein
MGWSILDQLQYGVWRGPMDLRVRGRSRDRYDTLGEARTACHGGPPLIGGSTVDVEGEDVFEDDRL